MGNQVNVAPMMYRLHPRITLEVCHQCLGRGFVMTVRGGKVLRENCTQCAAKGTIARDDGGPLAA